MSTTTRTSTRTTIVPPFRHRVPPLAWLLAVLLPGVALLAGCSPAPAIPDPASLEVPNPDLGEMDPALRDFLDDKETRVATQAAAATAEPAEVGRSFGELAQLYHIFDLLDAAALAYDNARRLQPEEYRWTYLLALVRVDQGDLEAATADLERALELAPESFPAWIRLGDVHLERNQPEEAQEAFERALELQPGAPAALFGLGRVAAAAGEPETAVARFEEVLDEQPQASVVHYPLAQELRQLGRDAEAESHLVRRGNRRVDFADPPVDELTDIKTLSAFQVLQSLARNTDLAADQVMGFALTHLGEVRGTVEPLERVIADWLEKGEDPAAIARLHYAAGVILVNQGEDGRAVDHFRSAAARDPGLTEALVKLGNALARQGRLAQAEEAFAAALEARPEDRELRVKRATLLLNQGRGQEALQQLRSLVDDDPRDATARIRVAEALEAMGNPAGAAREYRRALDAGLPAPAQARIHRARGLFHQRQGDFEAALEEYRQALSLDRDLVGARRDLAAVLGHVGRYDEAAAEYARVTAAFPDDPAARQGQAVALLLAGRLTDAVQTLEEGVAAGSGTAGGALEGFLARLLATAPDDGVRRGERALELARQAYEARAVPARAETVAMALAELGRYDEAVEWQRRAVDQLPAGPPAETARARLELYRSGEPYRARSLDDLLAGAMG